MDTAELGAALTANVGLIRDCTKVRVDSKQKYNLSTSLALMPFHES